MSSFIANLDEQIKDAMRAKDSTRLSVLRMIKSSAKLQEIDSGKTLELADGLKIIHKQIKQREESVAQYQAANRQDLLQKENDELQILKSFLPKQLSETELQQIIDKVIQSNNFSSKKDFGSAIKLVQQEVRGQADNKRISDLLNSKLK